MVNERELPVSKEKWIEFKEMQMSGMFNMFDPQAREGTSLTLTEWLYVMENYDELSLIYEGRR